MGICGSTESDKLELKRSKELDQQNENAFRKEQEKIKLLLLGAGESGKSTIFKQMKILYGMPLTDDEKQHITPIIYSNIISAMRILHEQCVQFQLQSSVEAQKEFEEFANVKDEAEVDPAVGAIVKALWADPGIQATWDRRAEYQIIDSVKFYFNDIDRIMAPEYLATQQDLLYARVRTSGIVEEKYQIDGANFVMYDVGGQRNERKKWIHCFEDVTAVIFVAALSEYDQQLYEDASTNRMIEALQLFDEICNNRFFTSSAMILFLNKKDLFEEKIKRVDIKAQEPFSDFTGGLGDFDKGVEYFVGKFLALNRQQDKEIYHHVTCATDSENVAVVFNASKDIILKQNIKGSGFM